MTESPLNPPAMTMVLTDFDRFSLDTPTLRLLHSVMVANQVKIVIEAGTYRGNFSCVAGGVVRDNGGGHVYTADAIDYAWQGLVEDNHLEQFISFIHGDFSQITEQFPAIVGQVDFALVDSGPPCAYKWEHEMRFRHYELAKAWCKPGGIVVVDDMTATDWHGRDIIWKEASMTFPIGHGVSIWQKPCTPSPVP